MAGKSKSSQKKHGIEGIIEGKDYKYFGEGSNPEIGKYKLYQPLTYEGSKVLASNKVEPKVGSGAKWCISYQKDSKYWDRYTERGCKFLFVLTEDTKYAITLYSLDSVRDCQMRESVEVYSFEDNNLKYPDWCKKDSTIEKIAKKIGKIDIRELGIEDLLVKNSDGSYSFLPNREELKEDPTRVFIIPRYDPSNASSYIGQEKWIEDHIENGRFTLKLKEWDGDFSLSHSSLASLEGCPKIVNGNFTASNCSFESLIGAPEKVSGNFTCSNGKLKSLQGMPQIIGGSVDLRENNLTSLEGCPKVINGNFNCSHNKLKSLISGPEVVKGKYIHFDNPLVSFKNYCESSESLMKEIRESGKLPKGLPRIFRGNLDISDMGLTSLEGCPEVVIGEFNCGYNNLTSLEGAPKEVGSFVCNHMRQLTSLKGGPQIVRYSYKCNYCGLRTLEGAPEEVGGEFDCSENPKLKSLRGAPKSCRKLWAHHCKLTSLEDCPQTSEVLYLLSNSLTSLKGIKPVVPGILDIGANPLESLDGLVEAEIIRYKSTNKLRPIHLGSTLKSVRKIDTNNILLKQEAQEAGFRV